MNFFDISGTNQNSFSIGLGDNKIELISKNGKLYLKNFDSSNPIDIASKEPGFLEIVSWSSGIQLAINNVVTYLGSVYLVKVSHTTGLSFDVDYFEFILSYDKLVKVTANNGNIYQIIKTQGNDIYFFGSNSGTQTIIFPNCLLEGLGKKLTIYNFSNCLLEIFLFDGTTYFSSINENQVKTYLLSDKSSEIGNWNEIAYWQLEEREINEVRINISNAFNIGDILGHDGTNFVKIDSYSSYSPLGIIRDCNNSYFVLVFYGYINLIDYIGTSPFPFVLGKEYYLSEITPGIWSDTYTGIKQPVMIAFSTTEAIVNFKSKKEEIFENITLTNNQSIFRNISNGIYKLYETNNPRNYTTIVYKNGSYRNLYNSVFSPNLFFDIQGNSGTINIYDDGNLNIENKTGVTITLTLITLKGQW